VKILFLANHLPEDNRDEEAISHAMRELGHEVVEVQEQARYRTQSWTEVRRLAGGCDWVLFLKHPVVSELQILSRVKDRRLAFWYFDMIRPVDGDLTLARRSDKRVQWMREVIPLCRVGFCTDGDFVADWNYRNGREDLVHLMQGADERTLGLGDPVIENTPPILFTGMRKHGRKRVQHLKELETRYGDKFQVFGNAGPNHRVHGRDLANLFASTKIIVAPDGPSTHLYWSNRCYLTLGLGGFLLHPWCRGLEKHYKKGEELIMYHDRTDLEDLIDYYLNEDQGRMDVRLRGLEATRTKNLYRHRCEELVREVRRRL
jgi:hypothetical protein